MSLDEAERNAHEMLDFLRKEYDRQAKPYIDILCQIEALRPPPPVFLTAKEAKAPAGDRKNESALSAASFARDQYRSALWQALAHIEASAHGENCYLSDHYDGDPGNTCNCGKDSIVLHLAETLREVPKS